MVSLGHLLSVDGFRESLTKEHLPKFLHRQRWYTSKNKAIETIKIVALPTQVPNSGLWLLDILFKDSSNELYVLAVAEVKRKIASDALHAICKTDIGTLVDGTGEEGFRESLYALMSNNAQLTSDAGTLIGHAGITCEITSEYQTSSVPPQNSSNTVVVYEPDGFFKLFRKTEKGVHPDAELLNYLSAQRGFKSVPAYGGSLSYQEKGSDETITLGLLLGRVDHNGELWETMQHDVAAFAKTYRDDPATRSIKVNGILTERLLPKHIPEPLRRAIGENSIRRICLLGQRTAEMHVHFSAGERADMRPELLDASYWQTLKSGLTERLEAEQQYAEESLKLALKEIQSWLEAADLPNHHSGRIRVHGDYHLGQVLETQDDVVIIDFEGEPLHSLAYRRKKHAAYKDVAGMIRSFHYAPYAYALQETDGAKWAMDAAKDWYSIAARLFLSSYNLASAGANYLPDNKTACDAMLAFFLADKVLYELAYERSSRPAWIGIPMAGVMGVAERLPR